MPKAKTLTLFYKSGTTVTFRDVSFEIEFDKRKDSHYTPIAGASWLEVRSSDQGPTSESMGNLSVICVELQ